MSYSAAAVPRRSLHSIDSNAAVMIRGSSSPAGAAWPTAGLAIYVPVIVPRAIIVKRLWYANGNTATGNYDIGLYDASGAAIVRRGSTAKNTTPGEAVWDCTDTTIGPGLYYLALSCSNNTDTFYRWTPTVPVATANGLLTETSAMPLPTTATFAITQSLAYLPVLGLLTNAAAVTI